MGTHYSHMTPADRISIQALLQAKLSGPAIAVNLSISRSTINRELNRSNANPIALASDYQASERVNLNPAVSRRLSTADVAVARVWRVAAHSPDG